MRSFSSALCFLILLTTTATTGSDPVEVKVELHESATLPCSGNCSGLVRWTVEHDPFHILALCDPTSCSSKEGFLISHDLYLRGDFSLNITDADLHKRTSYTCWCGGEDVCTVDLQIENDRPPPGRPVMPVWAIVLIVVVCILLAVLQVMCMLYCGCGPQACQMIIDCCQCIVSLADLISANS